jgi:subtilase family serine protease
VQYDLNPLYQSGVTGAGQSIAIVNESNIEVQQVNQFRSIFGLPVNPPVVLDGTDPGIDGMNNMEPNGASVESYLDVEWAGAVAPNATVYLVIAADSYLESGLILAAQHAVYSNIAPVISVSFGEMRRVSRVDEFLSKWPLGAGRRPGHHRDGLHGGQRLGRL